jgi:hypothetical protein
MIEEMHPAPAANKALRGVREGKNQQTVLSIV